MVKLTKKIWFQELDQIALYDFDGQPLQKLIEHLKERQELYKEYGDRLVFSFGTDYGEDAYACYSVLREETDEDFAVRVKKAEEAAIFRATKRKQRTERKIQEQKAKEHKEYSEYLALKEKFEGKVN